MNKYYFGGWQNFYHLNWPIRFLIEIIILLILAFLGYKVLKKISHIFQLKKYLIKGWVWLATEVVYLIGRNSDWAREADSKIMQWGRSAVEGGQRKGYGGLKCGFACVILVVYFLAIFVDLPIADHFQEYYLAGPAGIKKFFQKWESVMSKGYEEYPPLFVYEETQETAEETIEEVQEQVYIQLNEKGKNGSNIRQTPSLNGAIVGAVNGESEILYLNQWDHDGERYWINVYLPEDNIEGWLSGKLVDNELLDKIIADVY